LHTLPSVGSSLCLSAVPGDLHHQHACGTMYVLMQVRISSGVDRTHLGHSAVPSPAHRLRPPVLLVHLVPLRDQPKQGDDASSPQTCAKVSGMALERRSKACLLSVEAQTLKAWTQAKCNH
jgi:hypothetical protein